jgi:cytochrome b
MQVWDLPTRLFHWAILAVVGFSWWSAETGHMDWHYRSGIVALQLVAFRLIWGFAGSRTARFTHFLRGPRAIAAYLRQPRDEPHLPGHNPLGALSVVAMLLALAAQIVSGVFAVDVDGVVSGPLSHWLDFAQGRAAAQVHELSFTALQVLVALHVLAIVYYRVRGRRLVVPMITGRDPQIAAAPEGAPRHLWLRALAALAAVFALGWWVNRGGPL